MVTVQDIIDQARIYLNDKESIEYTDNELITYLNDGLGFMENILADNLSSITLSSVYLVSCPSKLPNDFLKVDKFEIDGKPLYYEERTKNINDDEFSIIGDEIIITKPGMFYYYKVYPRVSSVDDYMDIYKPLETVLKEYMVIKALSRLEYNTQEEQAKLNDLMNTIITIAKKRDGLPSIRNR